MKLRRRCYHRCCLIEGHDGQHRFEEDRIPTKGEIALDPEAEHTYAEREARQTARIAALRAMPRSGTQRRRVLALIRRKGAYGATDEEMQDILAMHHNSQTPRRKELEEGDWIIDSGRTRLTDSGSPAIVWVMSENGKRKLKELAAE